MQNTKIYFLYALFAIIAILVNIVSQMIILQIYKQNFSIELSIIFGTITGLLVKYILDKKWIFKTQIKNLSDDSKLFFFYTIVGGFTTVIFWSVEYLFHILFASDIMRYIGGIIGLTIGYSLKFILDKKFVFINNSF